MKKVVFSLSSEDMQQVRKSWSNRSSYLAEQGMTSNSSLQLAASNQRLRIQNGSSPIASCLQTEVEDQLAESLLKGQAQEGQPSRLERQPNDQVRDCPEMLMTLQRLTRISLLAALCCSSGFCPFPKCPTYFCYLFLLVIFEGYSLLFLDDDHRVCLPVSFSWG